MSKKLPLNKVCCTVFFLICQTIALSHFKKLHSFIIYTLPANYFIKCIIFFIFNFRIDQHLKVTEKNKIEDVKEGEELKKLSVQFQIEKERLENIRKDERKALRDENMQQIRDVEKMMTLQQQQDEVHRFQYFVFYLHTAEST